MRFLLSVLLLSTSLFAQVGPQQSAAPPNDGPTELIITYRCPPPRRAAFRQYMLESGIQRFEHWKQDGILKDYRFLMNWYVDVEQWDAMAMLSFTSYAQVARWKEIEKVSPGGLIRDALELAWPLNSTAADLSSHGSSDPPTPANSVFFVLPFDATAPGNTVPGMRDGLAGYSVYTNRYPGGKKWKSLIVLEYKDMDSFAHARNLPKSEHDPVIADALVAH